MKRHTVIVAFVFIAAAGAFVGCQSMYLQDDDYASGDFLGSGRTASFFSAIQVDPRAEDSAGPQFVAAGDFNGDGLTDLVSGWNQSQPVQIHVQRRRTGDNAIQFATVPLGGTTPIARIGGLEVADLDGDGFDDVIVLIKDTGQIAHCDVSREDCEVTDNGGVLEDAIEGGVVVFFNPQGAALSEPWDAEVLSQTVLAGTDEGDDIEKGGYTGIDIADMDGDGRLDIVVALNSAEGTDLDPPKASVDFYANPGTAARIPDAWQRYMAYFDLPAVGDIRIADVDNDGDNDIIALYPPAKSNNVRWIPNPRGDDPAAVYELWPFAAPIGQVATEANAMDIGDIDDDGFVDVLVRSSEGMVVQWFRKPQSPSQTFVRNPWQVYTLAEFTDRPPGAIALGDVTGDGRLDAAIAAEGAVAWFTPSDIANTPSTVFDQWSEALIIDDSPNAGSSTTQNVGTSGITIVTDPNAQAQATGGTLVETLLIDDLDGDGFNDIIATLDRSTLSGLSNDALVLLRNTRGD